MIELSQVGKVFEGKPALQGVSFTMQKGEMAFLTGHSGAGKTTLLKLIAGIESCSQGQVIVDGANLNRLSRRDIPGLRRKIGIILQHPLLLDERTVFENVALPLHVAGIGQQEAGKRVRAALDMVGLLNKERARPQSLSSGEQQRVSIARAIVGRPTLILADEPTGNLDPKLAAEIMRLFEQLNQVGVTMLIATHDLALIASMRHRILTLRQGRLAHS